MLIIGASFLSVVIFSSKDNRSQVNKFLILLIQLMYLKDDLKIFSFYLNNEHEKLNIINNKHFN